MQGTMEYHDSEDIEAKVARRRTGILRDLCPSNRKRSDQLQVNQRVWKKSKADGPGRQLDPNYMNVRHFLHSKNFYRAPSPFVNSHRHQSYKEAQPNDPYFYDVKKSQHRMQKSSTRHFSYPSSYQHHFHQPYPLDPKQYCDPKSRFVPYPKNLFKSSSQGMKHLPKHDQMYSKDLYKSSRRHSDSLLLTRSIGVQTSPFSNENKCLSETRNKNFIHSISYEKSTGSGSLSSLPPTFSFCSSFGSVDLHFEGRDSKLQESSKYTTNHGDFEFPSTGDFPMDPSIQVDGPFPNSLLSNLYPLENQVCTPVSDGPESKSKFQFAPSICSHISKPTTPKKRTRRACNIDGCTNRVVQGGLCIRHGAKRKKCTFPGCTKNVKKAGRCSTHGPSRKRCEVHGCTNASVKNGKCISHGHERLRVVHV